MNKYSRFLGLQFINSELGKGKIVEINEEKLTLKFNDKNKTVSLNSFKKRVKPDETYYDYFNRIRKEQLETFCKNRKIERLIHFTNVKNIESIFEKGLFSRTYLDENKINYTYNDSYRWDGYPEALCCSITFPNSFMLHKLKNSTRNNYVILGLSPKIIWEKECLFYMENAASRRSTNKRGNSLKDFENIFGDFDIKHTRKKVENNLKKQILESAISSIPTHPQAEVLVLDNIEQKYIETVFIDEIPSVDYIRNIKICRNPSDFNVRCRECGFWSDLKNKNYENMNRLLTLFDEDVPL